MSDNASEPGGDGYPTELEYVHAAQRQLSPAWIDHVLRFHGMTPPRRVGDRSFRYIDLGCGYGLTALMLAAAYPDAEFIGIDANREHIAFAQDLAREAGIANTDFRAVRFDDPSLADLAPATYVAAHGVYSWVPEPIRHEFAALAARLLAPGGAAIVSANLQAGWLSMLPVQRLLADFHAANPDRPPDEIMPEGLDLITRAAGVARNGMFAHGANTFSMMMEKLPRRYIAHEFLPTGWQPVWTSEMVRRFRPYGWTYCGDAELETIRDDFVLTRAQRDLLATVSDETLRLDLRNIILQPFHTRPVFSRPGAVADAVSRLDGWVALARPADKIEYTLKTRAGLLKFDNAVARGVVARLAEGECALTDLVSHVATSGEDAFLRVVDSLFASDHIYPIDPPQPAATIDALNTAIEGRGLNPGCVATPGGTLKKV